MSAETPATVVVAEKPSVARDIARVLGASTRAEGYLQGNGYTVTWAIGHLVRLAEPHEIRPEWRRWAPETLPLLPAEWPLLVAEDTRAQFEIVKRLICAKGVRKLVCATDAGREGELIFRYIYAAAQCDRPVERLWISSLTPEAIRKGFAVLRPARDFDPLGDAAQGRSRADWLVGMNLSRAATLAQGEMFSVGRVQTPTLALLAERELLIRAFVPEDYLELLATFVKQGGAASHPPGPAATTPNGEDYRGTWFRGDTPNAEAKRLPKDGEEARAIVARARQGQASVASVESETRRQPPPLLYDLTELQRHANRLYGLSARQTLATAQALYEKHKLLTYPRTDSRHLSTDVAATLPAVVSAISPPYREALAPGTGERPLSRRFVDDAQVSDHHAIIPTTVSPEGLSLSSDERRLYDLVCRRLLMAWHAEHVFAVTTVITRIEPLAPATGPADRYHSSGTAVEQVGWKALEPAPAAKPAAQGQAGAEREEAQELPAGLRPGEPRRVSDIETLAKRTRPPRRFTDATLLTAMQTAGQTLDDRELSRAMKERGLGTPATRAEIIETLIKREYLERQGKALQVTDKGLRLIENIHPDVKSPALTGQWEAELQRIEHGQARLDDFMHRIEEFVRSLVRQTLVKDVASVKRPPILDRPPTLSLPTSGEGRATAVAPASFASASRRVEGRPAVAPEPPVTTPVPHVRQLAAPVKVAASDLERLLHERFRLAAYRPYQEAVCQAVAEGHDVLLVMPTGAGKSLCYQLPGLARGGTTLVVSPLIALMEDQASKLQQLGLRAARIHSGRERTESRQVCNEYLAGQLDFLFIAPERLRVPGFPELLARRPPTLVAIDEAHCISEWGHDFRPDYRLLGGRLPMLRPAPVIALTATATPRVQDDIASQLGLSDPGHFIHGFRRTNIAIEVAQLKAGAERAEAVLAVLKDPARRPAIVYAPTRKESDALALELHAAGLRAGAYHAGMATQARERVQAGFVSGELQVIVATIAFGMGVDKADVRTVFHTGLPSSLEGYYQEIGRAGRDAKPASAFLLYSFADRRTHDFFHERDYPEPAVLERVFRALPRTPEPIEELRRKTSLDSDAYATALDKLWIHGGARIEGELVAQGASGWRAPYVRQRDHKSGQLDEMLRWAESHGCRMLAIVRHFGDQEDRGRPCGLCDVCAPQQSLVRRQRAPTTAEAELLRRIGAALVRRDGQGAGQLHRESGAEALVDRRGFERLLGGLARADLVKVARDTFEKDGQTIAFQRVSLTTSGRRGGFDDLTGVVLVEEPVAGKGAARGKKRGRAAATPAAVAGAGSQPEPSAALVATLKAWRLEESRRQGVPAFRILTDRTLLALAAARPQSESALLGVPGLGPRLVARHGDRLLKLVARNPGA